MAEDKDFLGQPGDRRGSNDSGSGGSGSVRSPRSLTPRSGGSGGVGRRAPASVFSRVRREVAKQHASKGTNRYSSRKPKTGRFNARGRGSKIAPGLKRSYGWSSEFGMRWRARRVIVKARVVKLAGPGSKAAYAHLRYLLREGASLDRSAEDIATERARSDDFDLLRDREPEKTLDPGHENSIDSDQNLSRENEHEQTRSDLYTSWTDDVDVKGFLKRGKDARHQFRFIVSPEDGAELGDLRPFTRSLMQDMERDLGTQLDWVAVDHYDTAHPHTHIVVRGVTDDGKILNIAGDYIAHGVRARASDPGAAGAGRLPDPDPPGR